MSLRRGMPVTVGDVAGEPEAVADDSTKEVCTRLIPHAQRESVGLPAYTHFAVGPKRDSR